MVPPAAATASKPITNTSLNMRYLYKNIYPLSKKHRKITLKWSNKIGKPSL